MTGFSLLPTDGTAINTIRTLAADVVGKANSGHPVSEIPRYSLALHPGRAFSLRDLGRIFLRDVICFRVRLWVWHQRHISCSRGERFTS